MTPGPSQKSDNFISGERILDLVRNPPSTVTQKYLPSTTPKYITGESILDTFLTARKASPKYLPASSTPPSYTTGESILDTFRHSSRPTPQYLPSSPSSNSFAPTENPLDNDIIRKAFFNNPTPHPDLLLYSTPKDIKLPLESKRKTSYAKFEGDSQKNGKTLTEGELRSLARLVRV